VFIRQLTYLPLIAGPVPTAVTVLGGLGFLYLVVGRSSVPCRGFPRGSGFSSSARPPGLLRRRDGCRLEPDGPACRSSRRRALNRTLTTRRDSVYRRRPNVGP
jgi:hypothetical protein